MDAWEGTLAPGEAHDVVLFPNPTVTPLPEDGTRGVIIIDAAAGGIARIPIAALALFASIPPAALAKLVDPTSIPSGDLADPTSSSGDLATSIPSGDVAAPADLASLTQPIKDASGTASMQTAGVDLQASPADRSSTQTSEDASGTSSVGDGALQAASAVLPAWPGDEPQVADAAMGPMAGPGTEASVEEEEEEDPQGPGSMAGVDVESAVAAVGTFLSVQHVCCSTVCTDVKLDHTHTYTHTHTLTVGLSPRHLYVCTQG
jgi:hypothetical protein